MHLHNFNVKEKFTESSVPAPTYLCKPLLLQGFSITWRLILTVRNYEDHSCLSHKIFKSDCKDSC